MSRCFLVSMYFHTVSLFACCLHWLSTIRFSINLSLFQIFPLFFLFFLEFSLLHLCMQSHQRLNTLVMQSHKGKEKFTRGNRTYTSTRQAADGTKIYTLSATPGTIINNTGGTSYDDTALKARVNTLESAPGAAAYDDSTLTSLVSSLTGRVNTLEQAATNTSVVNAIASGTLSKASGISPSVLLTNATGCTAGSVSLTTAQLNVPGASSSSVVIVSHVDRNTTGMSRWIEPDITKGNNSITFTWPSSVDSWFSCDFMVIG